ncbi:MAG: uridine kinase family protein [Bacillota bacterium]
MEQLRSHITQWRQNPRAIIGIEGYSGAGKTTLVDQFASVDASILPIHLDDFIRPWSEREKLLIQPHVNQSEVFQTKWYQYDLLYKLLDTYKKGAHSTFTATLYDFNTHTLSRTCIFDLTKDMILLEGIFLFQHKLALNSKIDKRVFLKIDHSIGDARRINRERERWGNDYLGEDHPDSYVHIYKKAYAEYLLAENPERQADLVISVN